MQTASLTVNYSIANASSTYGTVATVGAVTLTGVLPGSTATATIEVLNKNSAAVLLNANTPAGSYTEIVTALSNPNYTIASSGNVIGTLTINPAPITVTALGGTSVYGASPANPGLSATGLQNGQSVSVLTGLSNSFGITAASGVGASPYTLNVAGTLTNPNYSVSGTNTGTWTVTPAPITVTALGGTSVYGSSPANPGLSATGLQNGQSVSVLTGLSNSFGITSVSGVGSSSYTLNVAGTLANPNYSVSSSNTGTWTVTPARITVTALGGTSVYGSLPTNPGLSAAGLQNGQSVSVLTGLSNSFGITSASGVGSSPYTLNVAGTLANPNYSVSSTNTGTWTVTPAPITVTALGGTSVYGSLPTNPGLSAAGLQNGQSVSALTGLSNSFGITSASGVGSSPYTLNVAGSLTNPNYSVSSTNTGTWTVTPAPITVTALGGTSVYGSSPANPSLSATGLQNGQSVSALTGLSNSFGITAASGVGSSPYTLNVAGTLTNPNYSVSSANTGTWTVAPAPITVTALGGTSVYGSSPANPGLSATGLQNGQSVSVLTGLSNSFGITAASGVGASPYTLNVAGTLTNPNYSVSSTNTGTWTVTPAPITVTALGGTSVYGSSPANPGLSATSLQNGQSVSVLTGLSNSFGITSASGVGSTHSTSPAPSPTRTIRSAAPTGTWTVTPAPITVAALGGSSVYGSSPANPGLSATGLQNGQSVSALTGLSNAFGITSASGVGSSPYTLNVAGTLANPNYSVSGTNTGTWVVTPATLTYVANAANSTFGVAIPSLTGTATGFVNGQTLASATTGTLGFSTTATPSSNAGSYAITGSGLAATNGNYVFTQAPANANAFTIVAANDNGAATSPTSTGNYGTQQVASLMLPPAVTPTSNQPVITPISLGTSPVGSAAGTGGIGGPGGNPGTGQNDLTGSLPVTGSLASGLQGGNGAPLGTRLIDMPMIPLPPGSGLPPPGETRFVSNEVVLQFGPGASPQDIASQVGLTLIGSDTIGFLGRTMYRYAIANGQTVAAVIRAIETLRLPVYVEPEYNSYHFAQQVTPSSIPSELVGDPAQYVIGKFHLGETHRLTKGDNVVIAVINSEIDTSHPDLAGVVTSRFDAGCGATAPDPHGTGMTGAIAARKNLLGIAPNVKVIAVCAFGGEAGAAESTSLKIIKGLDYAIQQGARVINMSFAGPRDPTLAQALQIAREKGILLVGAAGNAGPKSPPLFPGADPNVIAVTATDDRDHLFKGANQGNYITVAAPGVDVLVPAPNNGIQLTTGTSVATAHVSGVAALLIAQKPKLTPEEIRKILVTTAKRLGKGTGTDPQFGAGLVDPLKALRYEPPPTADKSAILMPASAR